MVVPSMHRRRFLTLCALGAAGLIAPCRGRAAADPPLTLRAVTRTLDIGGRAATVFGLAGPAGRPGLVLAPGQPFAVRLENRLAEPTLVHWHGQIPPNAQDGVPDAPLPALKPGESRDYDFMPRAGTYWMHSHFPLQEMQLLAAPLIVHSPEDLRADRQEVVLLLHDFSFTPPEELLAALLRGGHGGHGGHGAHGVVSAGATSPDAHAGHGLPMAGAMAMDLNDLEFDAYLANDRTLDDPEVVQVERGGRVLVRIINAAAATVFWIDTGGLATQLLAVDGQAIDPLAGSVLHNRFGIAMGQRLDLLVDIPGAGAFPILALREGARERTGLILATSGAAVATQPLLGTEPTPAFGTGQELLLRVRAPLPARVEGRRQMVMLEGAMSPYVWTINGRIWGQHQPLVARSGERVVLDLHNTSMMAHPMHLHGHSFQVIGINNQMLAGALRDTVHVPPATTVTIAFDAGEAANWMFHCHHMPHLLTGMMTELAVSR